MVAAKQWYWLKHDLESLTAKLYYAVKKTESLGHIFSHPSFHSIGKKREGFLSWRRKFHRRPWEWAERDPIPGASITAANQSFHFREIIYYGCRGLRIQSPPCSDCHVQCLSLSSVFIWLTFTPLSPPLLKWQFVSSIIKYDSIHTNGEVAKCDKSLIKKKLRLLCTFFNNKLSLTEKLNVAWMWILTSQALAACYIKVLWEVTHIRKHRYIANICRPYISV